MLKNFLIKNYYRLTQDIPSMLCFEYVVRHFGYDWTSKDLNNVNWSQIDLSGKNLSKVIFPKDKEFFQKIKFKDISFTTLPDCDYSIYNFNYVCIAGAKFPKKAKLPENKDFFQKTLHSDIKGTILPEADYSNYDFTRVCLRGASFTKNSILPKDKDLFTKVVGRHLYKVRLPEGNYSKYNFTNVDLQEAYFSRNSKIPTSKDFFDDVASYGHLNNTILPIGNYSDYNFKGKNLTGTFFPRESILPDNPNLLKDIYDGMDNNAIIGTCDFHLTDNILKNIHIYDLSGIRIDFRVYGDILTTNQVDIIRTKYRSAIGKYIFLPKECYGKFKEEFEDTFALNI